MKKQANHESQIKRLGAKSHCKPFHRKHPKELSLKSSLWTGYRFCTAPVSTPS